MRILIAEDEDPQRAELAALVREHWPDAEVVEAGDGHQALDELEKAPIDVAFVDIRMPGPSGLRVAELAPDGTHIVFVTAHADQAVTAFEQGALDYLLKPVLRERFERTVERLETRLTAAPHDVRRLLGELRESLAEPRPGLSWITATSGDTVRLYPIEDVLAFHARDKYTEVMTANGDATIRLSLRELRTQLDERVFWAVHRSVLVRATAIESIGKDERGRHQLRLKGRDVSLPVSAGFRKTLRPM